MKKYKYIIITDDGNIFKSHDLTEDELSACDDGSLVIIDIEKMKYYFDSKWVSLDSWTILEK